ncbi:MAG: ATP-binding protein [Nitrospinae bacterium]|nr:ATP-binding protein [Nitrospinota bacterium]MBL7020976.1 ATP-binding protein [Nitrospinaceae bacterium]
MSQPIKLSIPSDPKYLGLIRKVLQELLDSSDVPDDTARRLILCVDEACANVIKHSYEGSCDEPIEATFTIAGDDFKVQIRDYGKQCDLSQIKPRDLEDIKPGGLGTHFINEIMDDVSYCTNRTKGTLLTMIKKIKTGLTSTQNKG